MQERRKSQRRLPESDLYVIDQLTDEPLGVIRDLTSDGCQLEGAKAVDTGHHFQCRMALPEAILGFTELQFLAESRWCTPSENNGLFSIGLEFRSLSDKEKMLIKMLTVPWEESREAADPPVSQKSPKA